MSELTKITELTDQGQESSWGSVTSSGLLEVISHFQLARVIFAMHSIGLASKLYCAGRLRKDEFNIGIDPFLGEEISRFLETHKVLVCERDDIVLTKKGIGIFSPIAGAQLGFYVEAYGGITEKIEQLLTGRCVYGNDIERDGRALGAHCATLFKEYHTPTLLHALKDIGANCILDLGCGGGQFLVDACSRNPELRGIGMDISDPAIQYAKQLAKQEGMEKRISFFVGDAFKPDSWPDMSWDADVLCASGVVHEHFREGEKAVVDILNLFESVFHGKLRAFILGEPELRYDLEKNDADLHLVHIFTAQGFPRSREAWLSLFEKTNLVCRNVYTRPTAGPRFNFFQLQSKNKHN